MDETVGSPLTLPRPISLHVPVVPLTNIAEHPLRLKVQVSRDASPEADEQPDKPVENHRHSRLGFCPYREYDHEER